MLEDLKLDREESCMHTAMLTIRIPNNGGLVFNCTWDKTLTNSMGSHCFGIVCVKTKEFWCAHCIIDDWVEEAKTCGMSFHIYL